MAVGHGSGVATVNIDVETVTPEQAAAWLKTNVNNRPIREHTVRQYANDMRAGRWRLNGDPIRFNDGSGLIDGQHRLTAVVEAGVPIESVVIRGLGDDDKVTFDSGVKRNFSDILKFRGERSALQLAAGIRSCWLYENTANPLFARSHVKPSHQQLLEWFDGNRDIRASVDVALQLRKQVAVPASSVIVPHLFGSRVAPEDTVDFFEKLRTGIDIQAGSSVHALRRYLELLRPRREKPPSEHTTALVIKAFNQYRMGESVELLHWRSGGRYAEPYPRIKDDEELLGAAA